MKKSLFIRIAVMLSLNIYTAKAQVTDSVATGHLLDAAEEYWPKFKANKDSLPWYERMKHMDINQGKGAISLGLDLREGYEYFDNYLWGIGAQDNNGYYLHRALFTADVRLNARWRMFSEIQSGVITGRNGGPRPVQDLNRLAVNQLFAEFTLQANSKHVTAIRVGKQALNYGAGTLLDVRDINVRRSFFGYKFIIKSKYSKLDLFYMHLSETRPGYLDDRMDWSHKVGGAWLTTSLTKLEAIKKLHLYYLFIDRPNSKYPSLTGTEKRHTVGLYADIHNGNWGDTFEADFQFGAMEGKTIRAWKFMNALSYQFKYMPLKPRLALHSAISSGDKDALDDKLQTFNPLFPKGLYYGVINNAGSANLMVIHPKADLHLSDKAVVSANYYRFWRTATADALYSTPGFLFIMPENLAKYVGWMTDVTGSYTINKHLNIRGAISYYGRGDFLKQTPSTPNNIFYVGMRISLQF